MAVNSREVQPRPERRARALADPTRMALLDLLIERARPVRELARYLKVPADRLYHHLDVLEQSGLVRLKEFRPSRIYEAVPFCGLGSEVVSETDQLELVGAAFDLVRNDAESAHQRGDALYVGVESISLTPPQLSALTAELTDVIERWSKEHRSGGARKTRVIVGAIPLAVDLTATDGDQPESE